MPLKELTKVENKSDGQLQLEQKIKVLHSHMRKHLEDLERMEKLHKRIYG